MNDIIFFTDQTILRKVTERIVLFLKNMRWIQQEEDVASTLVLVASGKSFVNWHFLKKGWRVSYDISQELWSGEQIIAYAIIDKTYEITMFYNIQPWI